MKIRFLSGALVLVCSLVSPGLAQRGSGQPPARPDETAPGAAVPATDEGAALPRVDQEPDPGQAPDPGQGPVGPPGAPRGGAARPPVTPRAAPGSRAPLPPLRPGQAPPAAGPGGPMAPPPIEPRVYVEDSGMKNQIFDVRHRDPMRLVEVLQALGSGRRGAVIDASREFNTLTVRDFPENLATIEAAIKRLDVPVEASSDIDLHLFVLLASTVPDQPVSELPAEIRAATQQLQSAFGYKGFRLLTPIMQRSREGQFATRGSGEVGGQALAGLVDAGGAVGYNYEIRSISREVSKSGASQIELRGFAFEMGGRLGNARIASNLSLGPGEQVVVGSASLNRTALILILSANEAK